VNDLDALKAATTTRLRVPVDERPRYIIPAWGFLEEIEIRPRADCPNFDAAAPYTMIFELTRMDGARIPVDVQIVARDLK
jgi:hypothetical protein